MNEFKKEKKGGDFMKKYNMKTIVDLMDESINKLKKLVPMENLKFAQDLIKTNNPSVASGFNMFVSGYDVPLHHEFHDHVAREQGYDYAKEMAKKGEITFTHKFRCECGGYPLMYGGFWCCNSCGGKNVDEDWWKIKVEKDGNEFCCHGLDFVTITESDNCAFGGTFDIAIENYGKLMQSKSK